MWHPCSQGGEGELPPRSPNPLAGEITGGQTLCWPNWPSSFILRTILWSKYCYHPHFTEEQGWVHLSDGNPGTWHQSPLLFSPVPCFLTPSLIRVINTWSDGDKSISFLKICISPIYASTSSSFAHSVFRFKKSLFRASLVAQWLRICLPIQGTQVRSLVREDPTCLGATKPLCHNYWSLRA